MKHPASKTIDVCLAILILAGHGCKTRSSADEGATLEAARTPYAMVIVGLDGPSDHGEIDRAIDTDTQLCLGNPRLGCYLLLPNEEVGYENAIRQCGQTARCQVMRYQTDDDVLEKLASLNSKVKVGLLIAHHTGAGLWDHPGLSAEALNRAAKYPLVVRACLSEEFVAGAGPQPKRSKDDPGGLIAVGSGILAESDTNYIGIVKRILDGRR